MKNLQQQWCDEGEQYAKAVNDMVAYADKHGWDNFDGKEPEDNRQRLAQAVFDELKLANVENRVNEFRTSFPPAHIPFIDMLEDKSQAIRQISVIDDDKIVFFAGEAWEDYKVYLLDKNKISELDNNICAIGKAKIGHVFAIAFDDKIIIKDNWDGNIINAFDRNITAGFNITKIIPFNSGEKALLISDKGIYLIDNHQEKRLSYGLDDDNEDDYEIDMEHGTLSHDNAYIAVGDQVSDHVILDNEGNRIADFYPMSSYPHFCEFSKDDKQLIVNSCHFYNGMTNGIDMTCFNTLDKEELPIIDEIMRVYAGVSVDDYYILGDAYGYIRAVDKAGKLLWQHFLGSTICSVAMSDDAKTLWVGSYAGFLHKLTLGKGHRDTHTIGTGELYEEFRLIIWKNEERIWWW